MNTNVRNYKGLGIARYSRATAVRPVSLVQPRPSPRKPEPPRFRSETSPDTAAPATKTMINQLDALRSMSVVVADTGELDLVRKWRPQDCTTNPRSFFPLHDSNPWLSGNPRFSLTSSTL